MAVEITTSSVGKDAVKADIEVEIKAFEAWFRDTVENTPLHRAEASILRTFLQWKLLKKD
jgi:hypothetical protein